MVICLAAGTGRPATNIPPNCPAIITRRIRNLQLWKKPETLFFQVIRNEGLRESLREVRG
jgi:hypothetical protein